ncbi:hypothetical protein PHJA_001898300 [Phtheirospermum japonicum]|uniref:Uncharacterized protein n=1 Tax=Phtheirospermum japonicum TaxID=374723 RepID=A0A830CGZ3_9LAMI|nr:hypothetical protein PHJA_001898300 [Phtheirospermum japonicum]
MAGTVYLKTDRFEVKLEGITFKTKDFESICKMGFLFPDGKIWARRPIVGLDVMYHPRDPSVILLLLCFGLGCVILRFGAGEALPAGIHKFLADKRIHVVGFGIPEKFDLFPFEELGLTKNESDIGYLAAKGLKDPKYKRSELDELARKVLGIKRMIGLTEASSFERHEQIKCAICQLFVTTVIAMGLSGANDKKKLDYFSKKSSFMKNLNSLHLLAEGWFKLPKVRKRKQGPFDDNFVHANKMVGKNNNNKNNMFDKNVLVNGKCQDGPIVDVLVNAEISQGGSGNFSSPRSDDVFNLLEKEKTGSSSNSSDDFDKKKPIKGILKCPSTTLRRSDSCSIETSTPPSPSTPTPPSPSTPTGPTSNKGMLKRANSKGYNVSFKFH